MHIFKTIEVPVQEALPTFDLHFRDYISTGLYPFIVGDAADLEGLGGPEGRGPFDASEQIEKAQSFDLSVWLKSKSARKPTSIAKGVPPQTGWAQLQNSLTGELKPKIFLGLIEVERPEHIFAKLGYGDFNECPEPYVHIALHRYWNEKYRTFPVTLGNDSVECWVQSPPTEKTEVLTLASEQYAYCCDVVDQGYETKSRLAASLVGASVWYFWWD